MGDREGIVAEVAERWGTPCYVYLVPEIDRRIADLEAAFGGTLDLSYAVKANPHHAILTHLRGRIPHLDVSSAGEIERALGAGWGAEDLSFTGPGKRRWELEYAIQTGVHLLVVESQRELRISDEVAAAAGITQRILLRIGPARVPRGFGGSMSGRPSQFGIDEEALVDLIGAVRSCGALSLRGFHIYAGTQCLSHETLLESFGGMIATFRRASQIFEIDPEILVFGAGFGIPYYPDTVALEIGPLAAAIVPLLEEARQATFPHTRFLLELGRFIVGEAGVFATSVIDVKESRGHRMVVCDGGMNHHLGAAGHLGTILPRNYRMFRAAHATPADERAAVDAERVCDVVGPLCTSIDTLGRKVELGAVRPGDIIGIECSGAYGLSVSPTSFISHPAPRELFVQATGDDGWFVEEPADVPPRFPAYRRRPER